MIPNSKPNIKNIMKFIPERYLTSGRVHLVGVRGYYLDSMGEAGKNDRGIYDDAIAIVSPEGIMTFNANCDPAVYRKGIANLVKGEWLYRIGIHNISKAKNRQYKALVQASSVTVHRDGVGLDSGMFGINIHRGDKFSVSSEGCQTIYPTQYLCFINTVEMLMIKHKHKVITYLLTENDINKNLGLG